MGELIWYCHYCGDTFPYNNTVKCPHCGSDDTEFSYDEDNKE